MTNNNHPNRGQRGPASNPTPGEIRAKRLAAKLTQSQSAALVISTLRAWQSWEAAPDDPYARRMHPGLWELYEAKLSGKLPGLQ